MIALGAGRNAVSSASLQRQLGRDGERKDRRAVLVVAVVAVLLLAALLRFASLATLPVGVSRDEAVNAIDESAISWTNRPVFFWDNSGREALFFYWQHAWTLALGVSPFAIRLAAASLGLLSVALEIAVARRFFGWRTGLLAGAILATMYWAVQDTRIGLRFTTTPVFTLLVVAALHEADRRRSPAAALVAGATIGLAANTYTSADAVALVGIGWAAYLLITRRVPAAALAKGVALALAGYAVAIAPLAWYLLRNPILFAHLDDLRAVGKGGGLGSTVASLAHNVVGYAWSIAGSGDIQWVQNVSGKPVYDWSLGALCYVGIAVLLAIALGVLRLRNDFRGRDGAVLCLLALFATLIPGIASRDAPYFLRVFGAVPVLAAAPALALDELWRRFHRRLPRALAIGLVALPIMAQTFGTTRDFFVTWAHAPDAQLRHGSGPAAISAFLRTHQASGTLYVSTNDPETVRALAPDESASVRWIHADGILPLPNGASEPSEYLLDLATPYYQPDRSGLYDPIESVLREAGTPVLDATDPNAHVPSARGYTTTGLDAFRRLMPAGPHAQFGGKVELVGASVEPDPSDAGAYRVLLALRAGDNAMGYARIGVSAVDDAGAVWGQSFLRALDTSDWRAGQLALSMQSLRLDGGTPPGTLAIDVTVWDDQTGRPLHPDGSEQTSLRISHADNSIVVPVGALHPLPQLAPRNQRLGAALDIMGVQLDTYAPRQKDDHRLALLWSCASPLPPGARLDVRMLDASGVALGDYAPLGLAARLGGCTPGVQELDRRSLHVGARWPVGAATIQASLYDGAGGQIASATVATVRIQGLPRTTSTTHVGRTVGATFSEGIRLLGLTVSRQPGSTDLDVDLVWRSDGTPARDDTAFVHIIGPAGTLIAQHDGPPSGGVWPTSSWEPGQIVADRHVVPLSHADVGPADILEVGMYDATVGIRLPILDPGAARAQDDALRMPLGDL